MALQPREKKMIIALAGVAVVGAFVLLKPGAGDIEEVAQGAVTEMKAITEEREATIQKLTGGGGSGGSGGGGSKKSGGSTSDGATPPPILSSHNSLNDCWVVFQDHIYDITELLVDYPGGNARIEKYCGTKDFEENFYFEQIMSVDEFLSKVIDKGEYKE